MFVKHFHSRSMRWIFSRPVACANVDVPTLTTIRITIPLEHKECIHYSASRAKLHPFSSLLCKRTGNFYGIPYNKLCGSCQKGSSHNDFGIMRPQSANSGVDR